MLYEPVLSREKNHGIIKKILRNFGLRGVPRDSAP